MKQDLNMNELSVNDLHLDYGTGAAANPILKGVSMHLQKGEVVALLGPSGSGKTTLLRAVAGLESPKAGTIHIGARQVFDGASKLEMPATARNLGLVFQSYALWPHKTVFDNVAYGLKLRKMAKGEIAAKVGDVLKQLGLGHLGERFPHQLSGGQQQRVAIARALVYNPPVILLDEPLSNLDAKLREEARAFLRELIVRLGLSALMVTHDQAEAMAAGQPAKHVRNAGHAVHGRVHGQQQPRAGKRCQPQWHRSDAGQRRRHVAGHRARNGQCRAGRLDSRRGRTRQCRAGGQRDPVAAGDLHVPGRPLGVPLHARRDQPARLFQVQAGARQLLAAHAAREIVGVLSAA
jgi:ABC-type nitrate/sulfonate/bicarbonate transport system ATPase subunit